MDISQLKTIRDYLNEKLEGDAYTVDVRTDLRYDYSAVSWELKPDIVILHSNAEGLGPWFISPSNVLSVVLHHDTGR